MPRDEHMIQAGALLLHWGPLDPRCFDRAKTWCEYYDPCELDQMVLWGATMAWLQENLIDPLESSNISAWYAPAIDIMPPPCEIMAISTDFFIDDIEQKGYLTAIMGEITSGTIFVENSPNVILSLVDDFDDCNRADLERLAKKHQLPWERLLPIRYQTRGRNPFGIDKGTLAIPVTPPTDAPTHGATH